MAHFNAAFNFQGAFTAGAWVTGYYIAQITNFRQRGITFPVKAAEMRVGIVGATDKVGHVRGAAVHVAFGLQALRADKTGYAANGFDFGIRGKLQRYRHSWDFLGF